MKLSSNVNPIDNDKSILREKLDKIPEENISKELQLDKEESKNKKNKRIKIIKYLSERYEFRFNLFEKKVEYKRKNTDDDYTVIEERDEDNLYNKIHIEAGITFGKSDLISLVSSDYMSNEYEPIKDYLSSLPLWDGKDRYNLFLQQIQLMNEDDRPLLQKLFKKWMITMVASLIDNYTKNETVLVLIGEEGRKKTRFFLSLVPKELQLHYLYIGGFDFKDKDHKEFLGTKILIINDELATMNRTDQEVLKSTMSLPYIVVRRAYGRRSLKLYRKASICGTTNDIEFLTDQGANRRYLPFHIHNIDLDDSFDIRALYAQSIYEFKNGFNLWYDLGEIKALSLYNEKFRRKPQEEELIQLHYTIPNKEEIALGSGLAYLTPSEIMHELASKDEYRKMNVNDTVLKRIGKTLNRLGFQKTKVWLPRFESSRDCWIVKRTTSRFTDDVKAGIEIKEDDDNVI